MPSGSGNNERRRLATRNIDLTAADTEYFFDVPEGASNVWAKLRDDTVAWRFTSTADIIDDPDEGMPVEAAGEFKPSDTYWSKTRIYVAHSDGDPQVLAVSYMYPVGAR